MAAKETLIYSVIPYPLHPDPMFRTLQQNRLLKAGLKSVGC